MMRIVVLRNKREVANLVAKYVASEIKINPNLVLGLAAGKTMIPFYRKLVDFYRSGKISFANVKTFNLDEYVGFFERTSLMSFMEKNFFSKVNLRRENIHFLNGNSKNLNAECARYEKEIRACGGIDLQILGIGGNGHIAFNEPGSSRRSRTRKVKLSLTTRQVNAEFFGALAKVPEYALTVGVGTILESKKILLLAFGEKKKLAVAQTTNGKASSKVPASFLQLHRDCAVFVDEKAAPRKT